MAVSLDAQAAIADIAKSLEGQSREGEFLENFMHSQSSMNQIPSTWDAEKATGQWDVIKKAVGDWLVGTAFEGSENPEGLAQQVLAKVSYPFRLANELTMESGVDGGIPFINYDPIGGFFGLMSGAYGIPANKWATGEDVTNLDAGVGALAVLGPVTAGAVRGGTNLARRAVPESAIEKVDETRRKILKGAGVVTGGLLAPAVAIKTAVTMGTKKAAGNVALAAGGMAETFMLSVGKLLDDASKKIVDTSKVIGPEGITHGANRSASSIIKMTSSQEWTRNFFERFREIIEDSLGPSKIGHPINAVQRVNDETTIGLLGQLTDDQFEYLMKLTGRTSKEGPKRINSVLTDGSNEVMDIIKAEKKALSSAQREFDDYWHKDWEFEGGWVDTPQLTRYERAEGNIKLLRQYEKELEILEQNDEMVKIMFQSAQDVKWGLMHIEHLAKTDPDTLIRILNQIAEEAKLAPTGRNFEELMQFRGFGGSGKPFGSKQTILEDRSETIRSWRVHGSQGVGDIAKKLLKELGEDPDPTRILSGTVGRTFDEPLIDIGKRERNWANMRGSSRKLSGRYYDESGRLDEYSTGRYASDIPHSQSSPPSRWVDKARNK